MVSNISQIVYQLFQKETLDEVSESKLRFFIRQYPYAGTGHLLLAKKLQLAGEKRAFEREIAVTSIYFNNPAWLQFILQDSNGNGTIDSLQEPVPVHTSGVDTYPQNEPVQKQTGFNNKDVRPGEEHNLISTVEVPDPASYNATIHEPGEPGGVYNGDAQPQKSFDVHEQVLIDIDKQVSSDDDEPVATNVDHSVSINHEQPGSTEVEQPVSADDIPGDLEDEVKVQEDNDDETDPRLVPESTEEQKNKEVAHEVDDYEENETFPEFIAEETEEEIRLNEETLNAPWEMEEEEPDTDRSGPEEAVSDEELRQNFERRKHLTSEVVAGELERPVSMDRNTEQANDEQAGEKFGYPGDEMVDRPDLISFEAQKASQRDPFPVNVSNLNLNPQHTQSENEGHPATEASTPDQKLEFDPYHTIDYFASQGIKLRLEDFSKDKLGQQLKSFTEWIRSMKRLPQQVAENKMDENDQSSIRRIAEHSVEEKEVLTESMAEVWVKQGNYEKARQIYRKLSLQNPSKSTYFAAKIDQLKVL